MKWNFQHRIIILMVMLLMGITGIQAQNGRKHAAFDPKKFQADLEQFITTNAALTPGEAARFFPMYRQMGKKMRMLFDEMRRSRHINPKDNEACEEAIRRQDEIDIQLKQLQQECHARFLTVLPGVRCSALSRQRRNSTDRHSAGCTNNISSGTEIRFLQDAQMGRNDANR